MTLRAYEPAPCNNKFVQIMFVCVSHLRAFYLKTHVKSFPSVAGTPTLGLALGCPYIGAELRANRLGAQNNMMFPFTTAERATCFIGKEATEDGERRAAVLAGTSMSWLLD